MERKREERGGGTRGGRSLLPLGTRSREGDDTLDKGEKGRKGGQISNAQAGKEGKSAPRFYSSFGKETASLFKI